MDEKERIEPGGAGAATGKWPGRSGTSGMTVSIQGFAITGKYLFTPL
jgi:hypothetical protein